MKHLKIVKQEPGVKKFVSYLEKERNSIYWNVKLKKIPKKYLELIGRALTCIDDENFDEAENILRSIESKFEGIFMVYELLNRLSILKVDNELYENITNKGLEVIDKILIPEFYNKAGILGFDTMETFDMCKFYSGVGEKLLDDAEPEKAEKLYERFVDNIKFDMFGLSVGLARACLELGKYEKVLRVLSETEEYEPDMNIMKMIAYYKCDNKSAAKRELNYLVKTFPELLHEFMLKEDIENVMDFYAEEKYLSGVYHYVGMYKQFFEKDEELLKFLKTKGKLIVKNLQKFRKENSEEHERFSREILDEEYDEYEEEYDDEDEEYGKMFIDKILKNILKEKKLGNIDLIEDFYNWGLQEREYQKSTITIYKNDVYNFHGDYLLDKNLTFAKGIDGIEEYMMIIKKEGKKTKVNRKKRSLKLFYEFLSEKEKITPKEIEKLKEILKKI